MRFYFYFLFKRGAAGGVLIGGRKVSFFCMFQEEEGGKGHGKVVRDPIFLLMLFFD